ncbi:MAG: NAD-dependent DNA ligase LigA, partial [Bacteroidaceae bacterium]|nr:NAD-dependent DNA ligase LigA [Bacteroidaceae bacterium]
QLTQWDGTWWLSCGEFVSPLFQGSAEAPSPCLMVTQRATQKVLDGIETSKSVGFDRLLYALGIRFVGKVAAKNLALHFRSMSALLEASLDELLMVKGIGTIIAQSVLDFFAQPKNRELVAELAAFGLQMQMPELEQVGSSLAGKSVVISGTFAQHSRDEYKAMIEQNGGTNVSSISKKTSFILAGENMGPAKLEKAAKLGVEIVDEAQFLAMLGK